MFDLLIKSGTVLDGTGAPRFTADIAIRDGRIEAIAPGLDGAAKETIDAAGMIVTPGFVDVHTHYDGQATWDDGMLPSSAHGVTTVVIGSCGIGFAPVREGSQDWLISLMSGVEDIPDAVLNEGVPWNWRTFPEYLDALAAREFALDIAAHFPHSALRAYVMGQRTVDDAPATAEDLEEMARLTREAIAAGAIGFGTSRISQHTAADGALLPGTNASEIELMTLAKAMQEAGGGVFQLVPSGVAGEESLVVDRPDIRQDLAMLRRIHRATGNPVTFSFTQNDGLSPETFNALMNDISDVFAAGENIAPQIASRPIGFLSTLDGHHAFLARPTYMKIADLPVEERAARMRDPATRAAILSESNVAPENETKSTAFLAVLYSLLHMTYPFEGAGDFEPETSKSVLGLAEAAGLEPLEWVYDYLARDDGRSVLTTFATNYWEGDLRLTEQLMREPRMLLGLADGGAHVRAIVDASQPTFVLTHWGRDRHRGPKIGLEQLVKKQSHDTASFYGLNDRGVLAKGRRADINIIDFDRLNMLRPYLKNDLPAGGTRFLQDSQGYVATIVAGVVTRRDDQDTGARPGRLVRGRQP